MNIHKHVVCISLSAEGRELESSMLSEAEQQAIPPRMIDSRKQEFILGRLAAHQALVKLGISRAVVLRGERGDPVWPEGVVGSITHSHSRAIAAVAWAKDIFALGIDFEESGRAINHDIVRHICTARERSRLSDIDLQRREQSLKIFSAKESVFKAFYPKVQRYIGFQEVELDWSSDWREFSGRVPPKSDVESKVLPPFIGTVAILEDGIFSSLCIERPN